MLLGDAQRLARGRDLAFRLPRAIGGLESIEERLRRGHTELSARQAPRDTAVVDAVRKYLLVDDFVALVKILIATRPSDTNFWPIARQCLRHILIDGAQRRALCVERRKPMAAAAVPTTASSRISRAVPVPASRRCRSSASSARAKMRNAHRKTVPQPG